MNRTFGVEIECGHDNRSEAINIARDLLRKAGLHDWLDGIHWDGSGCEIPSPVLEGAYGFEVLEFVMNMLVENGFWTSASDGLHVHYGADDFAADPSLVAHAVELWEENDPLIRQFIERDRRSSSWAKSRRVYHGEDKWAAFKRTKDVRCVTEGRYYAFNTTRITNPRPGRASTIELRLHEGTLDFHKAAAWIKFGMKFLDFAKHTYTRGEIVTCSSRSALLKQVGLSSIARDRLMAVERRGVYAAA